ncbi:MAG: MarR family transcriptional regulator [Anaerolineales bacterium]
MTLTEKFWESVPPAWFRTRGRIRAAAAEQVGLTVEQFQVLRRIRRGIDSVSAIAADKNASRPAVSAAVDGLVLRGLVTRQTDEQDRRHIHLTLTEAGQSALSAIYEQTDSWLAQRLARLSPAEQEQLQTGMEMLKKMMNDE